MLPDCLPFLWCCQIVCPCDAVWLSYLLTMLWDCLPFLQCCQIGSALLTMLCDCLPFLQCCGIVCPSYNAVRLVNRGCPTGTNPNGTKTARSNPTRTTLSRTNPVQTNGVILPAGSTICVAFCWGLNINLAFWKQLRVESHLPSLQAHTQYHVTLAFCWILLTYQAVHTWWSHDILYIF